MQIYTNIDDISTKCETIVKRTIRNIHETLQNADNVSK